MDKLVKLFTQQGLTEYLNYTQTIVVLIDANGRILDWNPAFERSRNACPGATALKDFLGASSQTRFGELLQAGLPGKAGLQLLPATKKFESECLLQPVADGEFLFFAEPSIKSRDTEIAHLTETLKETRHELEVKKVDLESVLVQANEVSHTDALTFLSNRKLIVADLQREVITCDRYHKPLTIFMADIDHFKLVNDTYGHAAGDQALRILSNGMLTGIRELDKLGRYGGEEFLFLLPATTIKASLKMADRLLQLVRNMQIDIGNEHIIQLTISLGIAQYRIGRESWDDLLKRADKALYKSKNNGRDQWTVANDDNDGSISSRSPRKKKDHPQIT